MQEALIVAVLTFAGLIAWAALINLAVKALFDFFDRQSESSASRSAAALGRLPIGKNEV